MLEVSDKYLRQLEKASVWVKKHKSEKGSRALDMASWRFNVAIDDLQTFIRAKSGGYK